ncbi:lactoylglutation lyase [Candidatus Bathyarchaeota archaeon]|nr:lactoylglutation lyase [Candidatus Bathyarchaeota archaeon]
MSIQKQKKEDIKIIHDIREQPWGQRVFRIYDPDNHIIEFTESMTSVVLRLHSKGIKTEEISKKTMMPPEFIKMTIQQNKTIP